MEILKYRYNTGKKNNLNFYRDSTGSEVDVLYNIAQKAVAVEIKSAETISSDFFKGLKAFEETLPDAVHTKALIYGGDRNETRQGVHITNVFGIKQFLNQVS
jgi:predicted AAA+ superfamily ATPase